MLIYNSNNDESVGYLNELYALLINILIQEDESYDNLLHESINRPTNNRTTKTSD